MRDVGDVELYDVNKLYIITTTTGNGLVVVVVVDADNHPDHTLEYNISSDSRNLVQQEGRKEMIYLMTHSTHFIYGYMAS